MDGNGVASRLDALISKRFLSLAGVLLLLLLGTLGHAFRSYAATQATQLADHRRWLMQLQSQADATDKEQARRTPIIVAAGRAVDVIHDIRVDVAVIKQQIEQLNAALEPAARRPSQPGAP